MAAVVSLPSAQPGPARADVCTPGLPCPILSPPSAPSAPPAPAPEGPPRAPAPRPIKHPITHGPGHDVRRCVSNREFHGAKIGTPRSDLERRWEVVGLGKIRIFAIVGRAWVYPHCYPGRTLYGVLYRNGEMYGKVWVRG